MPGDPEQVDDDIVPPRLEVRHVRHPRASWTSFDRYDRYGAIARALRATLGPGHHSVLDVGDSSGYLVAFDRDLDVVTADVVASADPLPGITFVVGDGACLPFADRSFDAVVTSDTLEHVAAPARPHFIEEISRVAREVVVLAAPFDTPGVAGVEELVRRYCLLAAGQPQVQLDEHAANGLPDLDATLAAFQQGGLTTECRGNGNLHDWLVMMLLKEQLAARPALAPLDAGYDILYNFAFATRAEVGPYYRHVVLGARSRTPDFGEEAGPPSTDLPDMGGLLGALVAANSTEAVRQDTVPELHTLRASQDELRAQIALVAERVEQLHQRFDKLTSPLRRVRGAVSPKRRSQGDDT